MTNFQFYAILANFMITNSVITDKTGHAIASYVWLAVSAIYSIIAIRALWRDYSDTPNTDKAVS